VIPTLLSCLGPEHNWLVQTAAGDFIKAIITISANASQNEQQCIGPNELTRQLVSQPCVEQLVGYMLCGGNSLTVGVGIIIEVIRKNNSDYDPDVGTEAHSIPSSRDPIYLGTLLRIFAQRVPDFMSLIMNAPAQKRRLDSTFGNKIEPLGFDRFKTCELMAELLHCSNMGLLNEVGSENLIAARDAERQRLRAEGKLTPHRGEEALAHGDELSIHVPHSSPDEGRRLEITNVSDDDGFEEVDQPGEATEDTSRELSKAESDVPRLPPSSFLGKEDDDFVDEPLSSPRLEVRVGEPSTEQQLDDPALVVAPLSPTKAQPPISLSDDDEAVKTDVSDANAKESSAAPIDSSPPPVASNAIDITSDEIQQGEESDSSVVYTPSVSETDPAATSDKTSSLDKPNSSDKSTDGILPTQSSGGLSPHPEDTPAPLFAGADSSNKAGDKLEVQPVAESEAQPLPNSSEDHVDQPAVDRSLVNASDSKPEDAGDQVDQTAGEASILVGCGIETAQNEEQAQLVTPVVGDLLKTQFVEHQVVPTILVSALH
jgi:SIT4-associating protein SAP185/190